MLASALLAGVGSEGVWSGGTRERLQTASAHVSPLPATGGAATASRCPALPGETVEGSYRGDDHGLLIANRDVVETYSQGQLDEFGGYQIIAGPPSTLRVAFTDHVAGHRDALRMLVPFPERLEVVEAAHSLRELSRIRLQVSADFDRPERANAFRSLSTGWQAVDVGLGPGREDLAAAYADRFGSAVRITVGGHPFIPSGCGPAVDAPRCLDLAAGDPAGLDITLGIVADTPVITAAQAGRARLVVHNLGRRRFVIDSGVPILGSLVLPGTTRVVGRWTGVLVGVGGGVDLRPGERGEIPVLFGATRCDGEPGSALPPGRYGLRAVLAPELGGEPRLLSGETTVTVSENPT